MAEMITLAHLSDVHLAPLSGLLPRYWNVKRGLGYLNWLRGRRLVHVRAIADAIAADALAQRPGHIVVTGDLVNLGLPAEYETARAWLGGLGTPDRVTAIPGNHDIYTTRMHGSSCLLSWGPYMASDSWGAALLAASTKPDRSAATFPFVRRIGPVALIGLNSAVPTPPFVASGQLGSNQLADLGPILDRTRAAGLARVVLIHHPPLPGQAPPRRGLADAPELARVIAAHGAELILHGHNHRDMLATAPSVTGSVPVVGLASASAARVHKQEPLARYNLLRIAASTSGFGIECVTRGLASPDGPIVEIARRHLRQGVMEKMPAKIAGSAGERA